MMRVAVIAAMCGLAVACDSTSSSAPEPVAGVSISGPTAELKIGQKLQLSANPVNANGATISGRTAVWSSNNETVATVSSSGEVTATSPGVAQITAVVGEGSGTFSIRVLTPHVASIVLTAPQSSVEAGSRMQVSAVAKDSAGTVISNPAIAWSISDASRAILAQDGSVVGQRSGTITITASADGTSGSLALLVVPGPATSISFDNPAIVYVGERTRMSVTISDAFGNIISSPSLIWVSGDQSSVTVDGSGTLTGIREAESVGITVRAGSAVASANTEVVRAVSIGSGDYTSCILSSAGKVYCWGLGAQGQLGVAPPVADTVQIPMRVTASVKFSQLSVGDSHECALTADGTAYCWGANDRGQVGTNALSTSPVFTPQQVSGSVRFQMLAAGRNHTCGIALDGEVYCWGDFFVTAPHRLPVDQRFTTIAAGDQVTCGLISDGAAYCFISTFDRNPQFPQQAPTAVPGNLKFSSVMVMRTTICGIEKAESKIYCWGASNFRWGTSFFSGIPVKISELQVKSISAGLNSICAISFDDRAYCRGTSATGQIGDGAIHNTSTSDFVLVSPGISNVTRFIAIAAGDQTTSAIVQSGAPYNWGRGSLLGSDNKSNQFSPLAAVAPRQ